MSRATMGECFTWTATAEGGFANDPADPGGATMEGITLATYRTWKHNLGEPEPSVDDLMNIPSSEWAAIAAAQYWNPVMGDALPAGVDLSVFDMSFNAGPHQAAILLQRSLGFPYSKVDGWVGPDTIGAAMAASPLKLIENYADQREIFYRSLTGAKTFLHGWINRATSCATASLALYNKQHTTR